MLAEKLTLTDYRCYKSAEIEFSPRVNIICGPNAAGKTNLLEALFYFSALKPLRPVKDKELVRRGAGYGSLTLLFRSKDRTRLAETTLSAAGGRSLQLNGVKIRKNTDFIGAFTTVVFSPEDLFLVKGAAGERRKFLDRAICQLRPAYYSTLSAYNSLLLQKHRLLQNIPEKPDLQEMLPAYNQELALYGAKLIAVRRSYIKKFVPCAARYAASLSGCADALDIRYRTVSCVPDEAEAPEVLQSLLSARLEQLRGAEIAAGTCLSGPHRDDLEIDINGAPARQFASQGQTRTAALALKLAEREISFLDTGEYPVLLLDDVLSELDPDRQNSVMNRAAEGQIVITCCSEERMLRAGRRFGIADGTVIQTEEL